jgi:uncharacterized protein (TIGR02996 family)
VTPSPQEEWLERALVAEPYDVTAWSAYADYLAEKGDPRGEFMQIQRALEDELLPDDLYARLRDRARELLAAHEREWVGDWPGIPEGTIARNVGDRTVASGQRYEFNRGLLTTAHFRELSVAGARAFVRAPQTRFVRELQIDHYQAAEEFEPGPDVPAEAALEYVPYPPGDHVLLGWPRLRQIRRFRYGVEPLEDYDHYCWFRCSLSGQHVFDYVRQMPDLEELLVFARVQEGRGLFALPLPRLRVLQLYHSRDYPLEVLAANPSMGNLTRLLCHPTLLDWDETPCIRLEHLRAVCRSPHLKALTHLRLRMTDFGDAGVREVVESGILKRLHVLDLRHGCVTDHGARFLAACPDLRELAWLDLSRNALTEAGKNALRATKVPVDLEFQHSETSGQDEDGHLAAYLVSGDIY